MSAPRKHSFGSPINIFVLFNGGKMIKIKRGASSLTVIEILGVPLEIQIGKGINSRRFFYRLKGMDMKMERYQLLFIDDQLELTVRT